MLKKINEHYFNAPTEFYLKVHDTRFVTEEVIRTNANPDIETQIFFWLWRIQRYFLIRYMDRTENSKNETAVLISGFLKGLNQFSAEIKKFLCTDDEALNCLVFSVLLSRDRSDWDLVTTLINEYNKTSSLLPLLQWSGRFYFEEGNDSCEEILSELIANHPTDIEFRLPNSPLSSVFKHVALCQWYSKNPRINPVSSLSALLPQGEHSHAVTVFPHIIQQTIPTDLFTNNLVSIQLLSRSMVSHLFVQFRLPKGTMRHPLAQFHSKEFRLFLNHFLLIPLEALAALNQMEELVGLSQMIQFYDPKPAQFCHAIYPRGQMIVRKLFAFEQYSEAYRLYADLIVFANGLDKRETVDARSSLYCICARIDEWLDGTDKEPQFNPVEQGLLSGFRTLKRFLSAEELSTAPLFHLAERLGRRFKQSGTEMTRTHCHNYYSLFSDYLNGEQKKKVAALFKLPDARTERSKRNHGSNQKSLTSKLKAVSKLEQPSSKSLLEPPTNSKVKKKEKTKPISKSEATPKLQAKAVDEIPDEPKKSKLTLVPSSAFFRPAPKIQCINRNSIPQSVLQLIDKLLIELPNVEIYLTGAAPSNILDGLKPNDYDLLVINATLPCINEILVRENLKPQLRSVKHPMIFCDIGNGISLDFTAKPLRSDTTACQVLEEDFSQRDFNVNALYCRFTQEESFQVFSFSNALKNRNARILGSIQPSVESMKHDPTRLFRLAKLLITNPKYALEDELQQALAELKGKWMVLFQHFIQADPGNVYRLNHAIKKLFSRYSYESLNKVLDQMGGLYELTELTLEAAQEACSRIPNIQAENKFFYWVLASRLMGYEIGNKSELCPTHSVLILTPLERDVLLFIYEKAPGKLAGVQVYVDEILSLVEGFKIPDHIAADANKPPYYFLK